MPIKDVDVRRANHARYMRDVWYPANKIKHLRFVRKNKRELRAWLKSLKVGKSCKHCSEKHPACLDYHHRDPKKKLGQVARLADLGWAKKRILAEIAKCDILCANCHRKEHWKD